ncbi:MAG: transporter substrate-binding domain-containing protein [Amaricoccus sp.]|uniref:transporter substrate-binding domain-containing protein n=1 Tax=Amaricoccus sp. TaxID=1872485 RepID=UPI0039E52593
MDGIRKLLGSALVGATAALAGTSALAQGSAEMMKPTAEIAALPGVALNETLAAALPAAIKSAGVLKVATDLTPPISFHGESGGLVGIDADLAAALGVILGVEVQMTDVGAGAAIVPSILSKRFDAGEAESWESDETSRYGWPSYEHQAYGFDAALTFIADSAAHIEAICTDMGLPLARQRLSENTAT